MCDTCGCHNHEHLTSLVLPVSGICCASCGEHVKEALEKLEGVHHVHIDFPQGTVSFDLDEHGDLSMVKKALNDMGYQA